MTRAARSRFGALEFQEYALAIVVVAPVRRRRDPQAGHVPDLGQRPQHAHPGERRRGDRDRDDVRDRDRRHRPLGRLGARRRRRLRRRPRRSRRHAPGCSSSARSASRPCSARSTPPRSPSAASSRSSRRWRCSRSRKGLALLLERQAARRPARSQRRLVRRPGGRSRCSGSGPARSPGSRSRSSSSSGSRSPAGCCSTAPATAATSSPSAATARRRGSPASRCAGDLQRLRALRLPGRDRDRAALRAGSAAPRR